MYIWGSVLAALASLRVPGQLCQCPASLPSGIVVRLPAALLACFSLQAHNNITLHVTGLNRKRTNSTTKPALLQAGVLTGNLLASHVGLPERLDALLQHLSTEHGRSVTLASRLPLESRTCQSAKQQSLPKHQDRQFMVLPC